MESWYTAYQKSAPGGFTTKTIVMTQNGVMVDELTQEGWTVWRQRRKATLAEKLDYWFPACPDGLLPGWGEK